MNGVDFTIGALAVWRITHLLHAEDGPFHLVRSLRDAASGRFLRELFTCFYCLSLWVALPVAALLARRAADAPLTWLALSGTAILAERLTGGGGAPPYIEE